MIQPMAHPLIILMTVTLMLWSLSDARGSGHLGAMAHCGNTRTSILMEKAANSEAGRSSPWIQMHYSAYVGTCLRVADSEITDEMAEIALGGLNEILGVIASWPRDARSLPIIIASIGDKAKREAKRYVDKDGNPNDEGGFQ